MELSAVSKAKAAIDQKPFQDICAFLFLSGEHCFLSSLSSNLEILWLGLTFPSLKAVEIMILLRTLLESSTPISIEKGWPSGTRH